MKKLESVRKARPTRFSGSKVEKNKHTPTIRFKPAHKYTIPKTDVSFSK